MLMSKCALAYKDPTEYPQRRLIRYRVWPYLIINAQTESGRPYFIISTVYYQNDLLRDLDFN